MRKWSAFSPGALIIEITQKPDPFADPEIENTYWDIMSRHGWFDKPG
jgi:hypothetical protein